MKIEVDVLQVEVSDRSVPSGIGGGNRGALSGRGEGGGRKGNRGIPSGRGNRVFQVEEEIEVFQVEEVKGR